MTKVSPIAYAIFLILLTISTAFSSTNVSSSDPLTLLTRARKFEQSAPYYTGILRVRYGRSAESYYDVITTVLRIKSGCELKRINIGSTTSKAGVPPSIFLWNTRGRWYSRANLLVRIPNDFTAYEDFNAKAFESLEVSDPAAEFKLIIPKAKADEPSETVLIERTLTSPQISMLRAAIGRDITLIRKIISSTKIGKMPGVTDNRDIVPVRAIYRIKHAVPFILEEEYYNAAGENVACTRFFDDIDLNALVNERDFELPAKSRILFPKDIPEYWTVLEANNE